ncbi:DUF2256 domain-containing protein [Aquabacterium sp.]|uniref:DUF2256 domain-containing protein n=1 Tax=Aquabacterium sp. TaxID=1872578 RepID=UPI0035C74246
MRMRTKSQLPTKVCACCQRPFVWRKKWERDWENVKYCSDRCRASGPTTTEAAPGPPRKAPA